MLIRRLTEDDLEAMWALRLQALRDSAEAFGSTYEETLARGKEAMLNRLSQVEDEMFYLGAFEEELRGMVGFAREFGVKGRHKGSVISLFVAPEGRGRGVGKGLMLELMARARRLEGLEQLRLAVVTSAVAARQLYRGLGFEVYGTDPRVLKAGGEYWDEDLMVFYL